MTAPIAPFPFAPSPARDPAGSGVEQPSRPLLLALGTIAFLALAVPLLIVLTAPRPKPLPHVVISHRVVPKTEVPNVEPVKLQAVDPTDARAINAAIPFSDEPNLAATAFRIFGADDSQARAVDCLAAAVYYEAGDDAVGERAVAQVVLNRMRHPAFPKTICGVVFQGSERPTGCQFTFTCDGSMLRYTPPAAAWARARAVARLALSGSVDRDVGLATHYHTDWVVPYWSASLEKISEVHTHLFFRWAGWWGTPPAFTRAYAGAEPNIALMARLSPNHVDSRSGTTMLTGAASSAIDPASIPASAIPAAIAGDDDSFLVTLPKDMSPDSFASLAIRTCGERPHCKFMAWADGSKTPAKLPLGSGQVASMSFSYLRDESQGFAKALWNCGQYQRPSPVQCMRVQPLAGPVPTQLPAVSAPAPQADFEGKIPMLTGIRRKGDPAQGTKLTIPVAKPTPTTTPAASAAP